jgi:hypothetical protein
VFQLTELRRLQLVVLLEAVLVVLLAAVPVGVLLEAVPVVLLAAVLVVLLRLAHPLRSKANAAGAPGLASETWVSRHPTPPLRLFLPQPLAPAPVLREGAVGFSPLNKFNKNMGFSPGSTRL